MYAKVPRSWPLEERGYVVERDREQCMSCGRCAKACPRGVLLARDAVSLSGADRRVQRRACIVQCPTDALTFVAPAGDRVPPGEVRRYSSTSSGAAWRRPLHLRHAGHSIWGVHGAGARWELTGSPGKRARWPRERALAEQGGNE